MIFWFFINYLFSIYHHLNKNRFISCEKTQIILANTVRKNPFLESKKPTLKGLPSQTNATNSERILRILRIFAIFTNLANFLQISRVMYEFSTSFTNFPRILCGFYKFSISKFIHRLDTTRPTSDSHVNLYIFNTVEQL